MQEYYDNIDKKDPRSAVAIPKVDDQEISRWYHGDGDDDDDDDDDEVMSDPKNFFKSTQNLVYHSLGVGGHRYMRMLCLSKLLWV